MKNYLLTLSTALLATIYVNSFATSAHDLIQFKEMERGHKDAWFDFIKEKHDQIFTNLKKDHDEWVAFGVTTIEQIDNMKDSAEKDKIFKEILERAIALHKKQKTECKKMHEKMHAKARELFEKNDRELTKFEKDHGLTHGKPETTMNRPEEEVSDMEEIE